MIGKFGTWIGKLYRKQDPDTSREAAKRTNTAKLEEIVYDVISTSGNNGMISDEVRDVCNRKYGITAYSSVTARYKSLYEKGLLVYTGETRKGQSGRAQRVMRTFASL